MWSLSLEIICITGVLSKAINLDNVVSNLMRNVLLKDLHLKLEKF